MGMAGSPLLPTNAAAAGSVVPSNDFFIGNGWIRRRLRRSLDHVDARKQASRKPHRLFTGT
jgi:hypothetical protein